MGRLRDRSVLEMGDSDGKRAFGFGMVQCVDCCFGDSAMGNPESYALRVYGITVIDEFERRNRN